MSSHVYNATTTTTKLTNVKDPKLFEDSEKKGNFAVDTIAKQCLYMTSVEFKVLSLVVYVYVPSQNPHQM